MCVGACSWMQLLLLGASLNGCEGDDGSPCSVLRNTDGSATLACEDGTKAILSGPMGGAGSPGTNTLTRVEDEPAGEHCPLGGSAIDTGPDSDRDGVLADGEVTAITYVCSGESTATGRSRCRTPSTRRCSPT
jgi:hypothetical protein